MITSAVRTLATELTGDDLPAYVYDLVGNRLTKTVDQGNDGTIDQIITDQVDSNDRLTVETVAKPLVSVTRAWRVKLLAPAPRSGAMNE